MAEVTAVVSRVRTGKRDVVSFVLPSEVVAPWIALLKSNKSDRWKVTIKKAYRERTTGEHSQNHRINGFIQQLCNATGEDFDVLKLQIKQMAIAEGYPVKLGPDGRPYEDHYGNPIPISEKDCTTVDAAILIGCIERAAAFLEVHLVE